MSERIESPKKTNSNNNDYLTKLAVLRNAIIDERKKREEIEKKLIKLEEDNKLIQKENDEIKVDNTMKGELIEKLKLELRNYRNKNGQKGVQRFLKNLFEEEEEIHADEKQENDIKEDQISFLKKENEDLKNNNIILNKENINLKKELTIKNQNINNYMDELTNLKQNIGLKVNQITILNNEISNLRLNANNDDIRIRLNDIVTVTFKSIDQKVDIAFSVPKTDLFVKLEEKLYIQYPDFRDSNNYFTINGRMIKRFRTIQENQLNNFDKILLNVYE